uniref:RPM1 interacting protein 13 n=1 Tax=Leersia perrieri TaxID=77586 RepID=A0A0D9XKE7_9ORYZ
MASVVDFVDISSDEEGFPVTKKLPPPVDSLEWLAELLGQEEERAISDEFDDLEVMGELSAPPVAQKKSKPDCVEEDDDDCVVLDGDPDDVVAVAEEKGSEGDGSSDELQIVAEKGPVACRDFPHSRHLCSNLPFSTTSHVKYCSMCHCYVCDTPAPCNYWGNGTQIYNHCHATDKEKKWKTLRQTFKCKSLPTSHPEKRQDVVYPTMASPGQQDTQCEISLVRPHPINFANQSHLVNVVNQGLNQTRETSTRVSSSVGRTINATRASPATRAVRGTGNAPTVQITQSRTRFKRVGATSPGLATLNDNQFSSTAANNALLHQPSSPHVSQPVQVAPRSMFGTVQKHPPQRSLSAPIAFQGQQYQSASSYQDASNETHVTGPQFARCISLTAQRTQFPEPEMDVDSKSWQDIFDSLASDLGVPEYNMGTAESQQPDRTTSQPLDSIAFEGLGIHSEPVPATANLMPSNGQNVSNGMTSSNGPTETTLILPHLNHQSSLIPDEAHLNNYENSPANGLIMEAAHHRDTQESDSLDLLFDFEFEDWNSAGP